MQHHGLADVLMNEVIRYADKHRMMVSLEIAQSGGMWNFISALFQGFQVLIQKHFDLKQYCLIREIRKKGE